jgi:hypothetical protein
MGKVDVIRRRKLQRPFSTWKKALQALDDNDPIPFHKHLWECSTCGDSLYEAGFKNAYGKDGTASEASVVDAAYHGSSRKLDNSGCECMFASIRRNVFMTVGVQQFVWLGFVWWGRAG